MILHNMEMLPWVRMSDIDLFNRVFFGAYAFTKPLDKKPSDRIFPFEIEDTIYAGRAGYANNDFFYDRKNHNEETGKSNFTKYTRIHRRLKEHKHNIKNKNQTIDRGTSYKVFHENYGWGEDVTDNVYVTVLIPRKAIPDFRVKVWTHLMENFIIDQYAENFGRIPEMNIDHRLDMVSGNYDETSAAYQEKLRVQQSNLSNFFND